MLSHILYIFIFLLKNMLYGLIARQLDAFLMNTSTKIHAFLADFRRNQFFFAMKKGYDFLKFREKMQNGDKFGKKTKHNE